MTNGGKILIVSDQTDINRVIVKLNLTNKGQNAFGTQVKVDYTSELSWSRVSIISSITTREYKLMRSMKHVNILGDSSKYLNRQ